MANELLSFSDLFQNRLFRIPDYQRGYAWGDKQLTDFWEDLLNLHNDRYHYTGLLSLRGISDREAKLWGEDEWLLESGYKPYHVVDGQQRLTTFSILMYELITFVMSIPENRDNLEENVFLGYESLKDIRAKYLLRKRPPHNLVTTYLFGYETDNPSSLYLKHKIFEEPYGGTIVDTYYTKNLKYAKSFFAENIRVMYDAEGADSIAQLYRKLTLRLMFNLHEIKDDYDVFVAFETMNNRGKRLTNLELLKNRLIYLTTLFDESQLDATDKGQLRKNINDTWKEVYFQLGRNQNRPLPDDDYLRAHWITYFQYTRRRGDDYINFLLSKYSAKNVFQKLAVATLPDSLDPTPDFETLEDGYDDSMISDQPESEIVFVSRLMPKEVEEYVNSLKALAEHWYYSFFPHDSNVLTANEKAWIDKLNRVGIGYFRPLVAATLATANKTTAPERVELFQAIERFIFLSFRVAGFNASYGSSYYYNRAREVLQEQIEVSEVISELVWRVENDMRPIINSFIDRTDRRFSSGQGFYGWYALGYFLYEYEYELSIKHNLCKIDLSLFVKKERDRLTIEHVLPQTPTNDYWQEQFGHYTPEQIRILSGSLGNLLPLAHSINSSLQNDSFPDKKKPSSGRRGYANGSHSEIEVAEKRDWTAESISQRGLRLLGFMERRWKIKFTDEQKIRLLHIEFV